MITVKELIEALKKYDQGLRVGFYDDDYEQTISEENFEIITSTGYYDFKKGEEVLFLG